MNYVLITSKFLIFCYFYMFCQKKTPHKTKVNSCFDSSEITANEGGVVNEF